LIWTEQDHNDQVLVRDPFFGLAANYISPHLFKCFARDDVWKQYSKHYRMKSADDHHIGGFVIECSTHGNETKHIDDLGWIQGGSNRPQSEPNLEAFLVLDLERNMPTIGFFTSRTVKKDEELTMDWGCWEQISSLLVPRQTLLSTIASAKKQELIALCQERQVKWDTAMIDEEAVGKLEPRFYNEDAAKVGDNISAELRQLCGPKLDILEKIMVGKEEQFRSKRHKGQVCHEVDDFDYTSPSARLCVAPSETARLSQEARPSLGQEARRALAKCKGMTGIESRRALKGCTGNTATGSMGSVEELYAEPDISRNVRVVEITDMLHPAKLFSVPDEKVYGVIANRDFKKGDAVMFYGGELRDFEDLDLQFDSYLFDLDMSSLGYKGLQLFISGRGSAAGMVNDPRSIGNTMPRNANLMAFLDWHEGSKTPQIVFAALSAIKKGEELLYDYGSNYWKSMWRSIMMSHAVFTAKTELECDEMTKRLEKAGSEEKKIKRIAKLAFGFAKLAFGWLRGA
jgi:hypothetical protein